MAFKINEMSKNDILGELIWGLGGTTGLATMNIFSGVQPASADDGTSGTLLCTISGIQWLNATNGTMGLNGTFAGTAGHAGTLGWARMQGTPDGIAFYGVDGDCGTSLACTFVTNAGTCSSGDVINLTKATFSVNI